MHSGNDIREQQVLRKIVKAIDYEAAHEFWGDECAAIRKLEEAGVLDDRAFIDTGTHRRKCIILMETRNPFKREFLAKGEGPGRLDGYRSALGDSFGRLRNRTRF